jgi:hypothetical protein
MSGAINALRIPPYLYHMPVAAQWKAVSLAHPPEGTTATYGTLDGRLLYRVMKRFGTFVIERARIVSGEFRPHLFYSQNDWDAAFPTHDEWVEVAHVRIAKADMPGAYQRACSQAKAEMIRQVAQERGISEDELTEEIAAKEEEKWRLSEELD